MSVIYSFLLLINLKNRYAYFVRQYTTRAYTGRDNTDTPSKCIYFGAKTFHNVTPPSETQLYTPKQPLHTRPLYALQDSHACSSSKARPLVAWLAGAAVAPAAREVVRAAWSTVNWMASALGSERR